MLQFRQNDTAAVMILTLTEKVTISDPYYLFTFTHATTKEVVTLERYIGADESTQQQRYNKFTINASTLFQNKQVGEWHYKVQELEAAEGEPGAVLEYGKLYLERATDFQFSKYETPQSFKVYNG